MSEPERLDARLVPAALAGWGAAALGVGWSPGHALVAALCLWVGGAGLALVSRRGLPARKSAVVMVLLLAGAALGSAALRVAAVRAGPVSDLAESQAFVHVEATISSDPQLRSGQFSSYVLLHLIVADVTVRGTRTQVRSPVLVIGDPSWQRVRFGDRVSAAGHLEPPQGPDLAAVLVATGGPTLVARAGRLDSWVASIRDGLTEAAIPLSPAERALLPALVDGDTTQLPDETKAEFQATGLTHLLAVSGSNLTLMLGFVLSTARWLRVRGYGLAVVGVGAVVFFVLLARPQPSVLRAAAMGVVALAGLSAGSRNRGVRVLCVAVIGLVVMDPWLARSVGFVLSTLATLGILVLAPGWRDLLARWMPLPLAEAIAVPLSAQLMCMPVIAAISGQVSLVAVFANLAAAPAVGPATITSLLAGLAAVPSPALGHLGGHLAGLPLWWIVWIAERGAQLSGASLVWGADAGSLALLSGICLVMIALVPRVLPHRARCLAATGCLMLAVLHPPGTPGWPPHGWVMVMCDVGQGDGLVLNAGHGAAVVVDTGPDPDLMRRCLDSLRISEIPLVVLTHFHADHVDGLEGVLGAARVGAIETSPFDQPTDRYQTVLSEAEQAKVPVSPVAAGVRQRVGELSWRVLGPTDATADGSGEDDGSGPNNASVIMLLKVAGITILLAGDAETEEDDALLAQGVDLRADILKEPHHGSSTLDPRFLAATHAAVSLISVGAGNPYGHPSSRTLNWLHQLQMAVYRTDESGAIAIVVRDGRVSIVTSR